MPVYQGPRWVQLMKKYLGRKSRDTAPLKAYTTYSSFTLQFYVDLLSCNCSQLCIVPIIYRNLCHEQIGSTVCQFFVNIWHINHTVPKEIHFPRYNMKCSKKAHIVSCLHYISYYIAEIWITFRTVHILYSVNCNIQSNCDKLSFMWSFR